MDFSKIPHGDMPGDKVQIGAEHEKKAKLIFPLLLEEIDKIKKETGREKVTVAVCGGSGVGKSEIASLLSYYLTEEGLGAYTMSGDNYPHRIPAYNDAERLQIFREGGMRGLAKAGVLTPERVETVKGYMKAETDASKQLTLVHDWFFPYLEGGRGALKNYLGTPKETDFAEVDNILTAFQSGEEKIYLRRMGRTDTELWYDAVDFTDKKVLVLEWTHGNNDNLHHVDIVVFLNSTPEETLAHRRERNRDGKIDSPFTTMVLELEQELLSSQAHKAKIIVSKSGELLDPNNF